MDKQKPNEALVFETLRVFFRAASRYKREMVLCLLNPAGAVLMSVAVPFFAGKILASVALQGADVTMYLVLLAVCSLAGVLGNRIGFQSMMRLQAHTMNDLHQLVFKRLLQRSVGFHANRVSGKLVSDALDFTTAFGMLANTAFVTGLAFASTIVIGVIVVLISSWQLGLFVTGVVAIILAWTIRDSRKRSKLRAKRLIATKALTSHLSDSIVNAPTVKTFAQEGTEIARNIELNKRLEQLRVRDWQLAGRSGNNRIAALLAMQFGMILLIIHLARLDPAILATGIFAFTYTLMLTNRLFEINTLIRQIEEAFLLASPMTATLREDNEIQDRSGAVELSVPKGRIDINDVSFAYPDNVQNGAVFEHFTLSVPPGEKVGLVGPSGGGKSTLTRLLLRFDEVQQGSIVIDGQDINDVKQESLRTAIAYVPQEPLLFHRSIRENIAYGKPGADDSAIIQAAKRANAHDFIQALPNGYDTIVGERGVKLSGGQRQRVAIARAMLKDAPILILDEATSALDSENELQVQGALWQLMQNRTAIVIAHRLSTIQKMDRIVVLDDGKIIEEGAHTQLLRKRGAYATLWKHQSGGFIEE